MIMYRMMENKCEGEWRKHLGDTGQVEIRAIGTESSVHCSPEGRMVVRRDGANISQDISRIMLVG